jgi:peroxiredoxin
MYFSTIAILATLAIPSLALAQDHPVAQEHPAPASKQSTTVSAEAATVFDRALAWYANMPGASTVLVQKMEMPGVPAMESKTKISVLKPNMFSITEESDGGGMGGMAGMMMSPELVCDGTTLWQAMPAMQIWSQAAAPKTLDVEATPALEMAGPATFVLELFAPDARAGMLEQFESVEYAGKSGEDDLLRFMTPSSEFMPAMPITLTIGPAKAPWIKRLSIAIPEGQGGPGMPSEMAMTFTKWTTLKNNAGTKAAFAFKAKADWKKVDDLMEALVADMGDMGGSPDGAFIEGMDPSGDANHKTVGKPAPDFTLKSLDGTDVSLSSLKGKIVILDFWATWCGPCRQGLPVLMEVAKARANDNVVLWAVDLDESKSKVQDFLKKKGWNLPVLLDAKGKVSQKYGVGGIPHTVIIGPDGVIHSVEIGFGGKDATMKKLNTAIDQIKGS